MPLRLLACLAAAATLLACFDSDSETRSSTSAEPAAVSAAAPATAPLSATALSEGRAAILRLPRDGLVIREEDDGLLVFAKHVPRWDVLRKLAVRFRFELVDWEQQDPIVDVFVEGAELEVALARLIEPTPYTLRYREDRREGRNRIEILEVGVEPEGKEEAKKAKDDEEELASEERRSRRYYRPSTEAEHRAAMERRALRIERRHAEALLDIEDEDPEVREDGASTLDASDPEDQALLLQILFEDPNPLVRVEAAKQLSFGDGTAELVHALEDPDPRVLIETLRALSWIDEPGLSEAVEPFLDHADRKVRKQAESAHYYLKRTDEKR